MTGQSVIERIASGKTYRGQLVHRHTIPPRRPRHGALDRPLPAPLQARLDEMGLGRLYSHQAAALNLIRAGAHVIIVSGTASGKTLCYNVAAAEGMLADRQASALYLFPTKALARDQLRSMERLAVPAMRPGVYDGDTPARERRWVRSACNAVLSNPDMLHFGVLPNHVKWGTFLANLKLVVLDEAHHFRGVFGSNVAQVLRRLRRLAEHYGASPTFVLTSATVANPAELARHLTGLEVEVVASDGSPCGGKDFLFWNPPLTERETGRRVSSNLETTRLLTKLVRAHVRTIAFSKSRRAAELVLAYARRELPKGELRRRVASYRAGYLPEERRRVESELQTGELLAVSSTDALELGIDIGHLEAALLNGFPGTIASTWQQAGRAGRRSGRSLAVLIGREDPLDQYYMTHPEAFFGKSHEAAVADETNPLILSRHLACAAYELPLVAADRTCFTGVDDGGSAYDKALGQMEADGLLRRRKEKLFPKPGRPPAQAVGIRSASQDTYRVVDAETGALVATVDDARAFFEIHPGAIYIHQGEDYLIERLDLAGRVAVARCSKGEFYTLTRDHTDIGVVEERASKRVGRARLSFGRVVVTTRVFAYQRRAVFTGEILGTHDLDLPEMRFETEAFWFAVTQGLLDRIRLDRPRLAGSIHAVEHTAIALLPAFAMCDRWDIGGVSTPLHEHTGEATIFIYDGFEGGIGIARRGFDSARPLLAATETAVSGCPCRDGCPSCVQSPKCGNWNEPLDKAGAVLILEAVLGES